MYKSGYVLRNRYELMVELGKGGMSTVFLARDKKLGSYWAIKHVKTNDQNQNIELDAFKKEVELLSTLNHADVPRIVDRIEIDDNFFVVMDFVDGVSLTKKVQTEGPVEEQTVVEWATLLCDILIYLHEVRDNPIVYRDMKPDNVMLTQEGRVKLIDFGIAKECIRGAAENGPKVGTKGFAAPEQYKGLPLDERTDIFCLGITLTYLLTGKVPKRNEKELVFDFANNPISEGMDYILHKCTNLKPEDRYQNGGELKADLERIETLNSDYRKDIHRRISSFSMSFIAMILAAILAVTGYTWKEENFIETYQAYINQGLSCEIAKDYDNAKIAYTSAIEFSDGKVDPYLKLFQVIQPKNDEGVQEKLMYSISTLRQYVENDRSSVYEDPYILYAIAKKCIEIDDTNYAILANQYINTIMESEEYSLGEFNNNELESLRIITLYLSKDIDSQDFYVLGNALKELERATDEGSGLNLEQQLENYYNILVIYSNYANYLDNGYLEVVDIGTKAKDIISNSLDLEDLEFNNTVNMYRLVASALYQYGIIQGENELKSDLLKQSLEWFEYIEDLEIELSTSMLIKKGNAYRGIFDSLYDPNSEKVDKLALQSNLDSGIEYYKKAIAKEPDNLNSYIYITSSLIDVQRLVDIPEERDFEELDEYYRRVKELLVNYDHEGKLTTSILSKHSSLKKELEFIGYFDKYGGE